ncbi:LOW QUALITY PROTEIN: transmembrane protein 132D [Plectropomus leopardus]|uniref:LOW QUALITY PROTEIN: transmembrane protein 132D n=1 Tax=Plectropomus leopardus TaxID=160734 RepID=UPI001C4BA00A|nr:LOW QUALITY PROTEIN: transmembrane protein 132D [Plectropomus leopardus]
MMLNFSLRALLPVVAVAVLTAVKTFTPVLDPLLCFSSRDPFVNLRLPAILIKVAESQKVAVDTGTSFNPSPVYPTVSFQVLNVNYMFVRQDSPEPSGNSSLKAQTQTFLITGKGAGLLQPAVNASYGPLTVDAPIPPDLLLSGRTILPVILARQVRSSSPVVKILFHMPTESGITVGQERMGEDNGRKGAGAKAKDGAHCVTAYAFWETREVRGACLVSPGGFCVAQLKPEPAWFSSGSRSGSSSREAGRTEGIKGLQGNLVEVYFQSRRDQTGQCTPQDSLQRVGVGRGRDSGASGTPMRRIGSVNLLRTPPGNPTFFRLRLGGAVVVQTSSKPLKATDVSTFYVFLASTSTLENFTIRATVKTGLSFSAARPSDSALWDIVVEPGRGATPNTVSVVCQRKVAVTAKRGLLEVLQLDFVPKDVSEQAESQTISWRLELPGNIKDVGIMRIYTTQRDYVGLAPLVMNTDILNTAVLTGETVSVPVKTLAVEADGTVTDVTNYTSCRSTEEDILKVSERCEYMYVNGKETRGKSRVMLNFTYGFLSAQLEMSVWMPRLPLQIDVADPELSQIKGWRVPVTTGNRRSTWDSEEEEEMRKGRGCMLQYQHSTLRVLTPFVAQADAEVLPDPLTGAEPVEYFLGPDWKADVTKLVRSFLKVADPDVARVQDGVVLQGRAVGSTTVQVLSPLTSSVLAERSIRVVDDKVSVTELGVQLVSGLSLSLQPSLGSNRAIVATATTREMITQLKQEAVVSCWVQFSDGAVFPLELFDRSIYSLTVSTPDEGVATVRRTPQSTFLVAQGEGGGQGAVVRVELRICEECQKSKRKSKLAVGTGLLRMNFQSNSRVVAGGGSANENKDFDGASELVGVLKTTVTSQQSVTDMDKWLLRSTVVDQRESTVAETTTSTTFSTKSMQPQIIWIGSTTKATRDITYTVIPTTATTTMSTARPIDTTVGLVIKEEGQKRSYGNVLGNPNSPLNKDISKQELTPKKEPPKSKTPKVIESDLIRTFKAMSDMEIGMYALVGVSCIAIFAFLLNCVSYNLCFRNHKTPIQAGPPPIGDPKDHKHDWVWLGSNNHSTPAPGAPAQESTLKHEPHGPLESRHSIDSIGHHGMESTLPTVSAAPAVPERTATLGRSRTSSQQQQFQGKAIDPMVNRSATLLARPHRSEPLHSPTSKRNQVQFTTFTTLDIKHLAALKKNGVDLNWANQQTQAPVEPQTPLPDMPWPVVKPLGEPQ